MRVFITIEAEGLVREMTWTSRLHPRVRDTFQFDDGHGIRSVVIVASRWQPEDYPGDGVELVLVVEPVEEAAAPGVE